MIKFNLNSNIFLFFKFFIIFVILVSKTYAEDTKLKKNLITLGLENAPVKIKIFSSFTCPHCADFHFNIIPKIKEKYINNGKVQLIFIDFPLDQAAFNASKLLHCIEKKKQINFMDTIYETQKKWANESNIEDINKNLKKIVKNLGISSSQFDTCLVDDVISDKILNLRIEAHKEYSIDSTPTIVINEKKLKGSASLNNIIKRIEKII